MFFSLQTQFLIFLQSFLLGVIIGLYYDILRSMRRHFKAQMKMTLICDSIFGLGALLLLFEFGLNFAAGQNRFYVLFAAAIGMVLYFVTISSVILMVLLTLLAICRKIKKMAVFCIRKIAHKLRETKKYKKMKEKIKNIEKTTSIFRKKGIK